jgi:glycosyltransferase involved in cell wall biosynthesis
LEQKKICIITQSHLCRNPRVLKEAIVLANAGYKITITNSTYSKELNAEDLRLVKNTGIKLIAVSSLEKKDFNSFVHRLTKKIGDKLVKVLGFNTHLALGYASWRYKNIALQQNADLYICHQELGLYCGVQLLKAKKKVAFDFEDWYSEDLLEDARRYRPIKLLQQLEKTALKNGVFCLSPSDTMGRYLAETYKANTPVTIYNTFDLDESIIAKSKTFNDPVKLFWFSQTIGPGRGLEQFFEIINKIDTKLEIHLLGATNNGYKNQLSAILQQPHSVSFHPLVPADELAKKIAEFDIGLALELNSPLNTNVTISNKFFQYALSGLPVIVTPTLGQVELFEKYNPGFLINDINLPYIAEQLAAWFQNKEALQIARNNALKFARECCWQNESSKLIKLVRDVKM